MHPHVLSILGRLSASALLLQTGAPVALSLKEGFDASAARKEAAAKAALPPPPMPGVPLMKATPAVDPPDYASRPRQIRRSSGFSLIDEQGRLLREVSAKEEKAWRIELNEGPTPARKARLLIQLAEVDINRHEPARAQARLDAAAKLLPATSRDKGLARFDSALTVFRQGRFTESKNAFVNLVKSNLVGVDRRIAVLYSRHAAACEGYHQAHNNLGIPEPRELDPLCGVSALAVCLRGRNMPYPKAELKKKIYYNGEGSSIADLEKALPSLGLSGHVVTADESGLKRLPKPLVAFVEHDHFVAVTSANKNGVEYFCSDCGSWPGGAVQLTWKQWRAMESSTFLAVAKQGSAESLALDNLPTEKRNGQGHVSFASTLVENPNVVAVAESMLSSLGTAVLGQANTLPKSAPAICGTSATCLQCLGAQLEPLFGSGIAGLFGTRDPVNLATGQEMYTANEGLNVYNPTGPSVSFKPSYFSLANTTPNGFGSGWTHPYNVRIILPSNTSNTGTLILPNSGKIGFYFSTYISGQNVPYPCGGANLNGLNFALAANYSLSTPRTVTSLVITYPDRTTWTFTPQYPSGGGGTGYPYALTKITDRAGNYISLNWSTFTYPAVDVDRSSGGSTMTYSALGLTAINDSAGSPLLTLGYSGSRIVSASDRYSRSIYFAEGTFYNTNVPTTPPGLLPQSCDELTAVSQIVATGTSSPPVRFSYGYQNYSNTENAETIPFLHTISVPSPTGTGMSTATVNYSAIGEVTDTVDANGNRAIFSPAYVSGSAQPNSARVQILGPSPSTTVVKQYDLYFDAAMNTTKRVDAAGNTVWTRAYSATYDPYGPTSITDGNGRTWTNTFDQHGRLLTNATPKGVTTTYHYSGTPLSEIDSIKVGTHATTYYNVSNGYLNSFSGASPGTTTFSGTSYTYTAKGNVKTVTTSGNNLDSFGSPIDQTTTFEYTTDGSYTQPERLGQPIKIIDSLGYATHVRYYADGTVASVTDASGYQKSFDYTLSQNVADAYNPATGNTGSGNSSTAYTYLYQGGPVTQVNAKNESGSIVRTTSLVYGAEGEALAQSGSIESATETYDAAYHLKTLTDGNSHTTTYTYDTVGHATKIAYPGASGTYSDQIQLTSFDPVGNLLSRTDGNGQVTNFSYSDTDGLLSSVSYPGATSSNVSLAYDDYDRLTSSGNGTEVTTHSYNDANVVTSTTQQFVGSGIATQTTNYTYWQNGLRKTMANLAGNWAYTYDNDGRYASMTSPAATAYAIYQNNGWQSGRSAGVGPGIGTDYGQNPLGQTNIVWNWNSGGSNMVSRYYGATFDGVFNLTGLSAQVPTVSAQTGTIGYGFDTKDRLTGEASPATGGLTQAYAYDSAGNATTLRSASGYTYDSDNRRTASGLAYDGNGNPTTYGPSMTFDPANRLTSFGSSFSYAYRPDNLRAWKQVGSSRTYFLYDGSRPIAELNSSGAVTATNVFAPDGLVARKQAGSWIYYQFDLQGNVAQRLDGSGNILSSSTYDAYGKEFTTATLYDPFSYNGISGYYHDLESDLYYCQNRYYDLYVGRWLTRDPAGNAGGINSYSYVGGGPVGAIDPHGLSSLGAAPGALTAAEAPELVAGATRSVGVYESLLNIVRGPLQQLGSFLSRFTAPLGIGGGAAATHPEVVEEAEDFVCQGNLLYRVVDQVEHNDLLNKGGRLNLAPGGAEGKYFWQSSTEAESYMSGPGKTYSPVSIWQFPRIEGLGGPGGSPNTDGIGEPWYVPGYQLPGMPPGTLFK
jgi:RHS repeat-associated protein